MQTKTRGATLIRPRGTLFFGCHHIRRRSRGPCVAAFTAPSAAHYGDVLLPDLSYPCSLYALQSLLLPLQRFRCMRLSTWYAFYGACRAGVKNHFPTDAHKHERPASARARCFAHHVREILAQYARTHKRACALLCPKARLRIAKQLQPKAPTGKKPSPHCGKPCSKGEHDAVFSIGLRPIARPIAQRDSCSRSRSRNRAASRAAGSV